MVSRSAFLYFNSSPSRPRKPVGGYSKSPILPARKLTKPKGRYTKGPVRSNGTKFSVSPIIPRETPRPTTSGNTISRSSAMAAGGSGGSSPAGGGMAPLVAQALSGSVLADLKRQATRDVALELDPQINARKFGINEATRQKNETITELQRQLGLRKTETNQLYTALDLVLQNMAAKQQQIYSTAKTSATSAYDTLAGQVNANYGTAQANTKAELARLGQSASPATGRLSADQAAAQGQVGAQKASATSTIDAIQAAASGEQSALRGAAQATRPMLIAQAQSAADQEANRIRSEWRSTTNQLRFEYRQLEGSRRAKVEKLYNQYRAEAEQAAQDAAQLQFMNSLRAAQLGISQGQLDLARQKARVDAQNSQANLVLRAKELQAKIAAQKKSTTKPTGMENAYSYLATYRGRVPQTQLRQALEDAINGNSNDRGYDPARAGQSGNIPGYDKRFLGIYLRDIDSAVRSRGWSEAERLALRNAVQRYLG